MFEVAIVIVSYNAKTELTACLEALARSPPTNTHQIIVVDNASSDGSPAAVRGRWPHITVIDTGANLGFARATNLGIRLTTSRMVLLLNGDTLPPPDAIDRLVDILKTSPMVAAVGPRLVNSTGALEISFGAMISPFNEFWQKCLVRGHRWKLPFLHGTVERRGQTERIVDWVSGACLLVNRADAEAVNLLDERFFLYGEDVDFCAAIRARGRHILFTPTVEVVHHRGRSGRHSPAQTEAAYRHSQLAFYSKHHPTWYPFLRAYLRLRGNLPKTD